LDEELGAKFREEEGEGEEALSADCGAGVIEEGEEGWDKQGPGLTYDFFLILVIVM